MRNEPRVRPFGDLGIRLLILVMVSLLLLAMQQSGQLRSLRVAVSRIASPLQWRMWTETNRVAQSLEQVAQTQMTREEQTRLTAENQRLAMENTLLQEALAENERLRSQLAYATANPRFTLQGAHVVAHVLGYEPHSFLDFIVIDAGQAHGLAVGMPVITHEGLVGRLSVVSPQTARVLLLNDVSSSVSGLLENSRVNGQVVGVAGGGLRMRFITVDDPIVIGDSAVTSRLGGTLPQGIPIGVVVNIEDQPGSSAVHAILQPAVDVSRLESVMVMTEFQPVSVEESLADGDAE